MSEVAYQNSSFKLKGERNGKESFLNEMTSKMTPEQ